MSEDINNDKKIYINELQNKLVNIEEVAFKKDSNAKSIFNAYNSQKEENNNQVEKLDTNELGNLINDIKAYDGKGGKKDNIIDFNEAEMFLQDFNKKHPDTKIETNDVFKFIKTIFSRYDYYETNNVTTVTKNMAIGEPLSEKKITLKVFVENTGTYQDIELSIKLYATDNENIPQQYNWEITKGKEYSSQLAAEYGYIDDNAVTTFIQNSLNVPNSKTYEVNFQPKYASTKTSDGISVGNYSDSEINSNQVTNDNTIIVPHNFSKDPNQIYAEYQNEEVQKIIQDFKTFLKQSINDSSKNLEEYLKSYGLSEKAANLLGYISLRDNTEENMKGLIEKAKELLNKMENADNSLEGILQHKDFSAYYKELIGSDFDHVKLKHFFFERNNYLTNETIIGTYKFVHNNIDNSVSKFVKAYNNYNDEPLSSVAAFTAIDTGHYNQEEQLKMESKRKYAEAYENLFNMYHNFIGVSRENWDKMFEEFKQRNINPADFIRKLTDTLINTVDNNTKKILNIDDLSRIDFIQKQNQKYYNKASAETLGRDGDLIRRIDEYHNSQVTSGIAISAIVQMALYSTGMAALSNAGKLLSNINKITNFKKLSSIDETLNIAKTYSGLSSGSMYASSYLAVDMTNRATNDLDDIMNLESLKEILVYTGTEFVAGYLFDGFLKSKFFGKAEKSALDSENKVYKIDEYKDNPTAIGEKALEETNTKFVENLDEKVIDILGARGIAFTIGGTKDGLKEIFKETCTQKYNITDIEAAIIIGAISNCFFIRFKNSDFAKQEHKIIGKFTEKSPKGISKKELKQDTTYDKNETYIDKLIEDIKEESIKSLKSQNIDQKKLDNFLTKYPNALNDMIINYYFIEYMYPHSK